MLSVNSQEVTGEVLIEAYDTTDPKDLYAEYCDSVSANISNGEVAKEYYYKALELAIQYNFEPSWELLLYEAWNYSSDEKYDSAEITMNRILEEISKADMGNHLLTIYYNFGYLYLNDLKYSESNASFEKLLNLALAKNDVNSVSSAYMGLSKVAEITRDFELSKQHIEDLLEYLGEESTYLRGVALQIYAEITIKMGEYDLAFNILKSAMNVFDQINDSLKISNVYNQIAWVYNTLGMPDSSIYYYEKSLEVSVRNNKDILSSDSYGNLGLIYFEKKDFLKAIEYLDSILEISLRTKYNHYIKFGYYHLSNAWDSIGNYEKALYNYKMYTNVVDSTRKMEIENKYINERTKFETERKEKELEIVSLKYKNNRIILYLSLGFIVLIIVVAFLLYRQSKLRAKNKLAEIEKQLVELKQLSLRKQMNPHFVFNTLNSIQYFMFGNDKMATNNYMSKFAQLVRKTFENSQQNSVAIKYELEALSLYIELEQLRFKKSFDFDIIVDEEIDTLQHKIPTMLIQPFVENSINHGLHSLRGNGKLFVGLKLIDDVIIECIVEDNGIGREKAEEIKRKKNKNHNSLGTSITMERLQIIDTFMGNKLKIEYVDLKNDNNEPIGTKVIIHIPIIT